jgi:ATP-dependent exoDNAse (exonuclease V) beta subunit
MPVHIADNIGVYDLEGIVPDHPSSPPLENERRLFYVALTRAIKQAYIGTTEPPSGGQQAQSTAWLPSRFLEELQLEPTKELIDAFQTAQETGQMIDLERALNKFAGHPAIVCAVTEHYLKHLENPALLEAINQRLAQTSEKPFQYYYNYPALDQLDKPAEQELSPEPWINPWEGIGVTI